MSRNVSLILTLILLAMAASCTAARQSSGPSTKPGAVRPMKKPAPGPFVNTCPAGEYTGDPESLKKYTQINQHNTPLGKFLIGDSHPKGGLVQHVINPSGWRTLTYPNFYPAQKRIEDSTAAVVRTIACVKDNVYVIAGGIYQWCPNAKRTKQCFKEVFFYHDHFAAGDCQDVDGYGFVCWLDRKDHRDEFRGLVFPDSAVWNMVTIPIKSTLGKVYKGVRKMTYRDARLFFHLDDGKVIEYDLEDQVLSDGGREIKVDIFFTPHGYAYNSEEPICDSSN